MAPSKFSVLWRSSRFSDVTLLLTTPAAVATAAAASSVGHAASAAEQPEQEPAAVKPAEDQAASDSTTAEQPAAPTSQQIASHDSAQAEQQESDQQPPAPASQEATTDDKPDVQQEGDQTPAPAPTSTDGAAPSQQQEDGEQKPPEPPAPEEEEKEDDEDDEEEAPCTSKPALPEGVQLPAHMVVLAASSVYFATRLETEVGTAHQDAQGRRLLVVEVDDDEQLVAAEGVLQVMYTEEAPPLTTCPSVLALMCTLADRWQAPACLAHSYEALTQLSDAQLTPDALAGALQRLPCFSTPAVQKQPQTEGFVKRMVGMLADVHAVLTSGPLLRLLRALPFEAVLAWAGSDDLVVDSEASVVVALDCWVRGPVGRKADRAQLLQLSGLVRLQHLPPTYHIRLLKLAWWHLKDEAQLFLACTNCGATNTSKMFDPPVAWLGRARKPLAAAELQRRTAIKWSVTRAELEAALREPEITRFASPSVYAAGFGIGMLLTVSSEVLAGNSNRNVGAFVRQSSYTSPSGVLVAPGNIKPLVLSKYTIWHVDQDGERTSITGSVATVAVSSGWGTRDAFKVSTIADLEPDLSDGLLKLEADFGVVC